MLSLLLYRFLFPFRFLFRFLFVFPFLFRIPDSGFPLFQTPVSVRHVGANPDELHHGISIQSSINLGKTFPWISRIRIIPSTQILAKVFVYLPPFIFQILDFTYPTVLVFILIYFEWRDNENQQFLWGCAVQLSKS